MKAEQIQVIFISKNPQTVDTGVGENTPMTTEELRLWNASQEAQAQARQLGVPIYDIDMNFYRGTEIVQLERWGFSHYPGLRIWAKYPDGKQAWYNLNETILDAREYSADDIFQRIKALIEGDFGHQPLLCRLFPPLCQVGGYIWLAGAVITTYQAINTKGIPQVVNGAAAALCWNEFFGKGGFKNLFSGQQKLDA